LAVVFS